MCELRRKFLQITAGIAMASVALSGCDTPNAVTKPGAASKQVTLIPASSSVTPTEMTGVPGALYSIQTWPFKGAIAPNYGTNQSVKTYTANGFTLAGAHFRWPITDRNPKDYILVPTTIHDEPFLVWCHLSPVLDVGKPENGNFGYASNQQKPTGPSQMWMTPWHAYGGFLNRGAILITNDLPPAFSSTGNSIFPLNPKNQTMQSLAGSAWTGWFQWGKVAHSFRVPAPKPPVALTVAYPGSLAPAYQGVILTMNTSVLGANQGDASNLYYVNLAKHRIVGLASLTNGGGMFSAMRIVSGMVFTYSATDLTSSGHTLAAAYVYNEATGKRTTLKLMDRLIQQNGFDHWRIRGSKIYDANHQWMANLNLPMSVVGEPSAATFGIK